MKHCKFLFLVLFLLFLNFSSFGKYTVMSRMTQDGGFFGYRNVSSFATIFQVTYNNQTINVTGWSVDCCDPGYEHCPKMGAEYLPVTPPTDWDATQICKVDFLMQYALDQIDDEVSSGSYSINVQVEGESTMRVYDVVWSVSGGIVISRDNISI